MGRRETPVDPNAGPVQRFAYELRKLRQEAGGLTYREMARRAHYSVPALSQAAAGKQLPSLDVTLAYVEACGGDPEEWERRWTETSEETASRERAGDEARSPYQGLARFEPDDHDRFFGRDELIAALQALTAEQRFTAVFGPSGSGKSSLLRAGLIPVLRQQGGSVAGIRILTPGERPLRTHAEALRPTDGAGDTVIVVDQFEEVFTLCHDPDERAQFVERLLAAREPDSRLRVVIAVRADFYGRLAEHRALADALSGSGLLVGPMSAAELRAAVIGPAQTAGLIVERELTARVVGEVEGEPGGLPLMSHVLHETWRRRRGRALTVAAYEAAGGLHGAIAQTAEDVYAGLSTPQAELARLILLRLITPGEGSQDTRRPVARTELDFADGPDDVALVLDRLAHARLITLDEDTVDLAHEALLTAWPRLRGWIEEDRERLRAHRRLTEAAQAWDDLGRDPGAVYRGARLDTADELFTAPGSLTSLEGSFLAASREARTGARRRRRGLIGALSLLVVLSLVAGVVAWQQGRTSDRRHAEAEARRIAAVAESMRLSDPVTSMRLGVAAWRLAETTETRGALVGAVAQREEDTFAIPGADVGDAESGTGDGRHLVDNGRTLMSVAPERITTWDVRTHRRTGSYPGYGDEALATVEAVAPDGRQLALWEGDGIRIWDVRAGRATAELPTDWAMSVVFGPGGDTLLVATEPSDPEKGGPTSVQAWDLRTRRMLVRVTVREAETVQQMAVSPDGRWLALCSDKRPLEIWDTAGGGTAPVPWPAGLKRYSCAGEASWLDFAPDNRTMALLTETGIRMVDFRSGRELTGIEEEGLSTLRFSEDGRFLAASGERGLAVWRPSEPHDPVPVLRYSLPTEASDFALDLDAHAVRYVNGAVTVVRSLRLDGTARRWEQQPAYHAQLAQDGATLAVLRQSGAGKGVQLLDTRDGNVLLGPEGTPCDAEGPDEFDGSELESTCVDLMAFSGDGRYFAYGRSWSDAVTDVTKRPRITVWDIRARREHAVIEPPGGRGLWGVQSVALTHDGTSLLSFRSWNDKAVDVWDVRRRERVRTVDRAAANGLAMTAAVDSFYPYVMSLAVRRNGDTVVTPDGVIADLSTGLVSDRNLGDDLTEELAFSPDGAYLAAADRTGRVQLWDGAVRRRLSLLPGTDDYAYSDPYAFGGYTGSMTKLAFSADSRTLAVGDPFGRVQLWDVPSSRPLGSALSTSGGPVLSLAFGAEGRTLYVAGRHVPLQKYDLTPSHLADQACQRAGGGLSAADWKTYLPDLPYRATC
ncbi:helix-turn-helix domain-containing protein [Streptomyces sp. GESEQ-4]|uniref:nSTAND1 domain-containing NTPase n=1 Tax=Streptomyces sp. GESEQ-4 TaxID=2812655 RepID=UPI001B32740C|nr:helix-turn-helix domain-containing protein [Streptomyces sp. GESEQ-4]